LKSILKDCEMNGKEYEISMLLNLIKTKEDGLLSDEEREFVKKCSKNKKRRETLRRKNR